jgi:hypothetical protein
MKWKCVLSWIWLFHWIIDVLNAREAEDYDEKTQLVWLDRKTLLLHAEMSFSCYSLQHYRICPEKMSELMSDLPDMTSLKLTYAQGVWDLEKWGYMRHPIPVGLHLRIQPIHLIDMDVLMQKLFNMFGITSELFKSRHITQVMYHNQPDQNDFLWMSLPKQVPGVRFTRAIIDLLPCKNRVKEHQ